MCVVLACVPCSFAHPLERWRAQCLPLLPFLGGNAACGGRGLCSFSSLFRAHPSLLSPSRLSLRVPHRWPPGGGVAWARWGAGRLCSLRVVGTFVGCCCCVCVAESADVCVCVFFRVLSACGLAIDGSRVTVAAAAVVVWPRDTSVGWTFCVQPSFSRLIPHTRTLLLFVALCSFLSRQCVLLACLLQCSGTHVTHPRTPYTTTHPLLSSAVSAQTNLLCCPLLGSLQNHFSNDSQSNLRLYWSLLPVWSVTAWRSVVTEDVDSVWRVMDEDGGGRGGL